MPGPLAGPGPHGPAEGWLPGQIVEINDHDERAVAWARGWLGMGAQLIEEEEEEHDGQAVKPRRRPERAAGPATRQVDRQHQQ